MTYSPALSSPQAFCFKSTPRPGADYSTESMISIIPKRRKIKTMNCMPFPDYAVPIKSSLDILLVGNHV
jgi:hypothetical protein